MSGKRGAVLVFVDGLLEIKVTGYGKEDGSGVLSFKEDDPDEGRRYAIIPKSELESIRDFLNKWLPPNG